jgi:sulfate adenylyltransferase
VTAGTLPAELASWPAWTPDEARLGELELLTSGAYAPVAGYLSTADLDAVAARGELADGTPWLVPVTLEVPADAVKPDATHLVLNDPEGSPLAVIEITEHVTSQDGQSVRLAGPVRPLRDPEHGPFRGMRRRPEDVKAELGGEPVLAVATRGPLTSRHLGQLKHFAGQLRATVVLLPLVGDGADVVLRPESLVRATLAAAGQLPRGTRVVPVPLARRQDPEAELRARATVAAAYGATDLLSDLPADAADRLPLRVVTPPDWAYDPVNEVWRPLSLIPSGTEREELSGRELSMLLDAGDPIPEWYMPPAIAAELRKVRPPRRERGAVIFFTGLSGSGKSTLARDLRDALAERGERTVSLLDGDMVRRLLSAGLTFSRSDRDLNIARIGYVATEVARHGGLAICAPIAPYAQARAGVREMVSEVGDFILVYVATPLEECEARDRKGLYAKARAGLIDSFTGISDPYEEPTDADLVIDTSRLRRSEAVATVLALLARGGWISER